MVIYLVSIIAGILMGMGIGGGIILIPALVLISDVKQHLAQVVTLTAFIPISAVAVFTHFRQKNIETRIAPFLIAGSLLGAILGANLAVKLSSSILRYLFAGFLFFAGIYELFPRHLKKEDKG